MSMCPRYIDTAVSPVLNCVFHQALQVRASNLLHLQLALSALLIHRVSPDLFKL